MKKAQLAMAATIAMGTCFTALPVAAQAQVQHKKHHRLATAAAGVAGYELAKHSHSRFARKHRVAAGVVAAVAAHHYMKKHDHPHH